jgi:hypothetical protein
VQRLQRLLLAQVAKEAEDQIARDAELALGPGARRREAADHVADRHAAGGVRLRVEEQLGADDVVGSGARKYAIAIASKSLSCSRTLAPA